MQRIDGPHGHQRLGQHARLRVFAQAHIDLEDSAVDRRFDHCLVEIDPRLLEGCPILLELSRCLFALRRENLDLLLRAGKSGLRGGNASLGFLRVRGSGLKALTRRLGIAGEFGIARVIE